MHSVLHEIWIGMSGDSPTEQAATLLGVLGVWLMIRLSLWAFPVGMAQVALSAIVFYRARFYADMKLQGVFFVALAYGWWHWTHGGPKKDALRPITRLSSRGWAGAVGSSVAFGFVWGWYLKHHTDAAMPYRDAFISSFSIVSQWLQSRKVLENWHGWILVNAAAVPVYWLGGMAWFSVLYFLFLLMAIGGYREWRRDLDREAARA